MQNQSIKTQAARLRALAPEHLGRELSSIQALQLTSRMHGYANWQTAKASEVPLTEVSRLFTVSYAADTSTDGLYMTEPEVFLTRDEAFAEARDRIESGVFVDGGAAGYQDGADDDDSEDEDDGFMQDRLDSLRAIRDSALDELDEAHRAGQGGCLITVEFDDAGSDDNVSNFSVLVSEVRLPRPLLMPGTPTPAIATPTPSAKRDLRALADSDWLGWIPAGVDADTVHRMVRNVLFTAAEQGVTLQNFSAQRWEQALDDAFGDGGNTRAQQFTDPAADTALDAGPLESAAFTARYWAHLNAAATLLEALLGGTGAPTWPEPDPVTTLQAAMQEAGTTTAQLFELVFHLKYREGENITSEGDKAMLAYLGGPPEEEEEDDASEDLALEHAVLDRKEDEARDLQDEGVSAMLAYVLERTGSAKAAADAVRHAATLRT